MADLVDNATPAWRARVNETMDRFRALPTNRKVLLLAAIAALFSVIVGLALLNREPNYKILFANVPDREGGQITAALQQMNVPYTIVEGGVISVPANQVHETRLKLAAQGLPKSGGVGFELMDNQKFGVSQFAEQVNYQRSIEGELARTIESVGSVNSARVHLAIPKQTVFVRDREMPTASVMLDLQPGRVLDAGQIAGIVHLVSSAVPNLPAKNVTVVDQEGTLLSTQPDANNSGTLDQRQLSYVKQVQQDYVKRIEDILEPIFGKGNIRAQVTTQMDFSEVEETSEVFRPNSSPNPSSTRSQQIVETLGGTSTQPTGVPGALSNQPPSAASAPISLPPGAAPGTATLSGQPLNASGTVHREITTNYEVDKTISHTKQPKGQVKRISAAVVVNYRMMPDRTGELKPTPLTAQEIQQVNNLVRETMGYNAQRGDTLNVVNAAFTDIAVKPTLQEKAFDYVSTNGVDLLKYLLLAIAVLYLIFGVVRPIMRDLVKPPKPAREELPEGVAAEGGRLLAVAGEEEETHETRLSQAEAEREKQRKQYVSNLDAARELVKNDPRMAAQIIKEWIKSDE